MDLFERKRAAKRPFACDIITLLARLGDASVESNGMAVDVYNDLMNREESELLEVRAELETQVKARPKLTKTQMARLAEDARRRAREEFDRRHNG